MLSFWEHLKSLGLNEWADNAQVLQGILALVAIIPVVRAIARAKQTAADQKKMKHFEAWQTINSAQGIPGNAGRVSALEELVRDGVPLVGIDLRVPLPGKTYLRQAHLAGADLRSALLLAVDLTAADLTRANLGQAHLDNAILTRAVLCGANLEEATLGNADLEGANLSLARLTGANLWRANLKSVDLRGADLTRADLREATVEKDDLHKAASLKDIRVSDDSLL